MLSVKIQSFKAGLHTNGVECNFLFRLSIIDGQRQSVTTLWDWYEVEFVAGSFSAHEGRSQGRHYIFRLRAVRLEAHLQ